MAQPITMARRKAGANGLVYILAEMACSHDGSEDRALRLIDAAREAGADGVQLQFFHTEALVTPNNPIHETLLRIQLGHDAWGRIHEHARQSGLDVWACVFDPPSVELARDLGVDGVKLNSSDLSNPVMLHAAASLGATLTLGCGASTLEEIAQALDVLTQAGATDVILMHGVQNFPTPLEDANLRRIALLRSAFCMNVGYADHTDASDPAAQYVDLTALGYGACLLEKHFTLDRSEKRTDYQAALEPDELMRYVALIRLVEKALGSETVRPLTESDRNYRKFQKKSIVAAIDLPAGRTLREEDVRFLRTGGEPGLPPTMLPELLGRAILADIPAMTPLRLEDLARP